MMNNINGGIIISGGDITIRSTGFTGDDGTPSEGSLNLSNLNLQGNNVTIISDRIDFRNVNIQSRSSVIQSRVNSSFYPNT